MKYNETSGFDASPPPFAGVAPGIRRLESIAVFSGYLLNWRAGLMYKKFFADKDLAYFLAATLYRSRRFIPQILRYTLR
jgi:hypothetical protein